MIECSNPPERIEVFVAGLRRARREGLNQGMIACYDLALAKALSKLSGDLAERDRSRSTAPASPYLPLEDSPPSTAASGSLKPGSS